MLKKQEYNMLNYKFNFKQHIHELNGKPLCGTSSVIGVLNKPLTYWASGLACEKFGWLNSKLFSQKEIQEKADKRWREIMQMSPLEYLDLLDEAYKAHSVKLKDSASDGTDLHAELEKFIKNHILCQKSGMKDTTIYAEKILPFIAWTEDNVDKFLWSELHCFSEKLWLGGISDVGVQLKNGEVGILDFKSSKEAYNSQFIQCALYDTEITENGGYTADGKKIFELEKPITFYGIVPFGAKEFKIDFRYNVDELKKGGEACCVLYKLTNH